MLPNIVGLVDIVTAMGPKDTIEEGILLFEAKVKAASNESTHQGLEIQVGFCYRLERACDAVRDKPSPSDEFHWGVHADVPYYLLPSVS